MVNCCPLPCANQLDAPSDYEAMLDLNSTIWLQDPTTLIAHWRKCMQKWTPPNVKIRSIREFSFQFQHYLYAEPGGSRRNYSELIGTNMLCKLGEHISPYGIVPLLPPSSAYLQGTIVPRVSITLYSYSYSIRTTALNFNKQFYF